MPDYMRALHQRFGKEAPEVKALEGEMEQTEKQLKEHLDVPQRKLLLRLMDQQSELRGEVSLYAFIAGYRLACGIHRELRWRSRPIPSIRTRKNGRDTKGERADGKEKSQRRGQHPQTKGRTVGGTVHRWT